MPGDSSSYAALGLAPGADPAAIERAYKKLIKEHHPDRTGGDSRRAAEINRAYRELKKATPKEALELYDQPPEVPRPVYRWVLAAMGVVAGVGALLLAAGPVRPIGSGGLAASSPLPIARAIEAAPIDQMDQPLALAAIDSAVRDARHIARTRDEMGLSTASQACHRELRDRPSLFQLDRCAAFDDAVVMLQDRDPLRDRGPFSEPAVTGRQWSAASALSGDYLAIDGRLDRIQLRVETVLAPLLPDSN